PDVPRCRPERASRRNVPGPLARRRRREPSHRSHAVATAVRSDSEDYLAVSDDEQRWLAGNQRYLMAAVARVRRAIESRGTVPVEADDDALRAIAAEMPAPPALERLCAIFGLSRFECDVIVLCAAVDLDATFAR